MNTQSILNYISNTPHLLAHFKETSLHVEEIGDGNLNYIFRISDEANNSLILKYAPPYLRMLGEGFTLPQKRICVEMHTMSYFEQIAPSLTPKIIHCDEEHFCFMMEDLKGYALLQTLALTQHQPLAIYETLGSFLVSLYHHKPCIRAEGYYENPTLKAISRDYIFRFPHILDHDALILPSFFTPSPKSDLFLDNIAWLTTLFEEDKSCLLHGDLHTGSVMVKGSAIKIIDAEFSFFGPIGFDIGVLLAHILFNEIYTSIAYNSVCYQKIHALFKGLGVLPSKVFMQSVGFCGAELFRRLVVPAKAKPLEALAQKDDKVKAYVLAETLAIDLVEHCLHVTHLEDFMTLVEKHL